MNVRNLSFGRFFYPDFCNYGFKTLTSFFSSKQINYLKPQGI